MRALARDEAKERLREEFSEIETTHEALLDIVKGLPPTIREGLGTSWRSMTKQVVGLRRLLLKRGHLGEEAGRSNAVKAKGNTPDEK